MARQRVVIAVKRGSREHVGDDWVERVRAMPGVHRVDAHERDERRAVAEVAEDALDELRESLIDDFHVEELIAHVPRKK